MALYGMNCYVVKPKNRLMLDRSQVGGGAAKGQAHRDALGDHRRRGLEMEIVRSRVDIHRINGEIGCSATRGAAVAIIVVLRHDSADAQGCAAEDVVSNIE